MGRGSAWWNWRRTPPSGTTPACPPYRSRGVLIRDPRAVFPTQALLCTDLTATPEQIVAWFVLRWQLAVTLEEVRRHLGVETQGLCVL